jgi:hypothetical protein
VGHDVEEERVGLARVEERQDVRVLQTRRRPDLGEKALRADDCGELGAQHLERDLAPVPEVIGQVDGGHAALAEFTLDAVATVERAIQPMGDVGHGANILHATGSDKRQGGPPSYRGN